MKACIKSLHFEISSGKKKRLRIVANFTSPAPKPKKEPTRPRTRKIRALIGYRDALCTRAIDAKIALIANKDLFLISCVLISTADR